MLNIGLLESLYLLNIGLLESLVGRGLFQQLRLTVYWHMPC